MSFRSRYSINGFVDTKQNIWDNVTEICTASQCWLTHDGTTGKLAIVLNEPDTSVATIEDGDMLGELQIDIAPFDKSYNKGEMKFANRDMIGKFDTVGATLTASNLPLGFYNSDVELPNKLTMSNRFINDDIQAQLVLEEEIINSRCNITVTFFVDYSFIYLEAGNIVTLPDVNVTPSNVSYPNMYRIIEIEEEDTDTGDLILKFTVVNVNYQTFNGSFSRNTVDRATGIPPIKTNTAVQTSNEDGLKSQLANINVPVVGGGTDVYSSIYVAQTQVNIGYLIPFIMENIFFTLALPYNNTAGSYYSGTINVHLNPTFDVSGFINSTTSLLDTFTFSTDTPTVNMQYEDFPAGQLWLSIDWDSTPSASDLDLDRYERASGVSSDPGDELYGITGPMKLGRSFLYTPKT